MLDLDHTLLDSDTSLTEAFGDAMAVVGQDVDGHYATFDGINRDLWRAVERGELTPPQVHVARFEQLITELESVDHLAATFCRAVQTCQRNWSRQNVR